MTPARKKPGVKGDSDFSRAERAAKFILSKTKLRPTIGVVLGSGLGAFADELSGATRIPYAKIPDFPHSTAVGHAGCLVIGKANGIAIAAMQAWRGPVGIVVPLIIGAITGVVVAFFMAGVQGGQVYWPATSAFLANVVSTVVCWAVVRVIYRQPSPAVGAAP